MEDWQNRVIGEKAELDKKIIKLTKFIHSENFLAVMPQDQEALITQLKIMTQYSNVLRIRIQNFLD